MRARAAIGAGLLGVAAGCGGGLSKSELVAKGDAICARVNEQIAKEPAPKTTKDLERLAQRTVEISKPAIEEMQALEPPGELEDEFKDFVDSLERQRDLTRDIGAAAGSGDATKVQRISADAQKAQADYRASAEKIGFKVCGKGS